MNAIDLIAALVLLIAVWSGWRQGFIVQVCSLAGLVAAIWLASRYGEAVGAWLGMDAQIAAPGGFVTVLVVVVIAVAVASRLVKKVFHFAGFGIVDIVLGIVVSVLKCALLLSVLLRAFDRLNEDYTLVEAQTVEHSIVYKPLMHLSEPLLPFLEWIGDRVPVRGDDTQNQ